MAFSLKRPLGFTLVEIMVTVAIIALLATFAIPGFLRAKISANEANAKATLKTISTALETYSLTNGAYPTDPASLLGQAPPYLNKDYFSSLQSGYNITPSLQPYMYSIVAAPSSSSQGTKTFTMATGGVLTESP
jgi:type IV pilus assembly protein PilE